MAKSQALKILNEIKAATFENAAQLPLKESAHPEWQGLGYQVGGFRLDQLKRPPGSAGEAAAV